MNQTRIIQKKEIQRRIVLKEQRKSSFLKLTKTISKIGFIIFIVHSTSIWTWRGFLALLALNEYRKLKKENKIIYYCRFRDFSKKHSSTKNDCRFYVYDFSKKTVSYKTKKEVFL